MTFLLPLLLALPFVSAEETEDSDGTIVVTGTRTEKPLGASPVATEVITREDIEASGAEDLGALLEEHPGVDTMRSYLGTSIRLQGLEPEHVLIMVNGERVIGMKGGVIDLTRFPAEYIERIEIVKGPSSALYGSDAMGGVVNIITRDAKFPLAGHLHVRYGSFATLDASAGLGVKRDDWSSQFIGGFHTSDGYDLDPSDIATTGSALDQFDFGNQTKRQFGEALNVTTNVNYLQRKLQGIDISGTGAIFDRTNLTEDFQASIKPRLITGANSVLRLDGAYSIYRDQYLNDQRDSSAMDSYEDTREQLAHGNIQYDQLMGDHFVTVGTDLLAQQMISERLNGGEGDRYGAAFYFQDDWTPLDTPRLTLLPGARLDLDTSYGVHPTPKFAVRFDPTENLVLRASYGWGYRAPAFKELFLYFENPGAGYVVEGNPDLQPETSESYQFSVEAEAGEWLWVSTNAFYNEIDNLIGIGTLSEAASGEPARYGYINVSSATTRGVETAFEAETSDLLSFHAGYTFTDGRDNTLERALEGRAKHRGTMRLSAKHEGWGLNGLIRAGLVGSRTYYIDTDDDGDEDTVLTDPYVTLDTRLAKSFNPVGEVFVGVDNLLNAGDVTFLTIPPRFFYLGLTGRFTKLDDQDAAASLGLRPHAAPSPLLISKTPGAR